MAWTVSFGIDTVPTGPFLATEVRRRNWEPGSLTAKVKLEGVAAFRRLPTTVLIRPHDCHLGSHAQTLVVPTVVPFPPPGRRLVSWVSTSSRSPLTFDFEITSCSERPRANLAASWARENEAAAFAGRGRRGFACAPIARWTAYRDCLHDSCAEVSAADAPLLAALARRKPNLWRDWPIRFIDITEAKSWGESAMVDKIQLTQR